MAKVEPEFKDSYIDDSGSDDFDDDEEMEENELESTEIKRTAPTQDDIIAGELEGLKETVDLFKSNIFKLEVTYTVCQFVYLYINRLKNY